MDAKLGVGVFPDTEEPWKVLNWGGTKLNLGLQKSQSCLVPVLGFWGRGQLTPTSVVVTTLIGREK